MKMQLAVLLTCFNRKATTLRCLEQLNKQNLTASMDVFLCDDGSTDGTSDAIKKLFPQVYIIKGSGNLFWNRGMLTAWRKACETKDYDAYIWLNDDVYLYEGALQEMLECSSWCKNESIVCGAFCTDKGEFSYGGKNKKDKPLIPNGELQQVYWLNGNCVLVPKYVVAKIGLLDGMFQHHMGDFDYGLRAQEAGINVCSSRKYIGECAKNPIAISRGRKSGVSMFKRFQRLYSPLGDNPFINFRYTLRHFGLLKALHVFIALHINNVICDRLYKWKNKKIDYERAKGINNTSNIQC